MERTIIIQNTPVKVKTVNCFLNNSLYLAPRAINEQFIDITFIIGNKCNANCKFCCGPKEKLEKINISKFKTFFLECTSKINVRKVTFTGGEPTLNCYFNTVKKISSWIKSVSKYTDIYLNTNGTNLQVLNDQNWLDKISLSRHHFIDYMNDKAFNTFTASLEDLYKFKDKRKINLICVCQKNYIENGSLAESYMDHALKIGINNVAFISLIGINEYSKENYIDPSKFEFSNRVLCYKHLKYPKENICECFNYIYTNPHYSNSNMFFYIRKNLDYTKTKYGYIVWKNNKINFY